MPARPARQTPESDTPAPLRDPAAAPGPVLDRRRHRRRSGPRRRGDAAASHLWVYGPGRRTPTQLEAALRRLMSGEDVDLDAHPFDPAHHLHLDDAAEGIPRVAAAPRLPRPVYDIAPGAPLSMGEVAQALGALFPGRRVTCARAAPGAPIPRVIDVSVASRDFGFVSRASGEASGGAVTPRRRARRASARRSRRRSRGARTGSPAPACSPRPSRGGAAPASRRPPR